MNTLKTQTARLLVVCSMSLLLPVNLHAWEPSAKDLDAAINTGDFAGYSANSSAWLDQKTPADPGKISEATMKDLLKDPVFVNTLDQRQFIEKHGVANMADSQDRKRGVAQILALPILKRHDHRDGRWRQMRSKVIIRHIYMPGVWHAGHRSRLAGACLFRRENGLS